MKWRIVAIVPFVLFTFGSSGQIIAQQPNLQSGGSPSNDEGKRYEHKLEASRFDPGAGQRREVDGSYERVTGDRGVFLIDRITGATLAVPSAPKADKPPAASPGAPADQGAPLFAAYPQPLTANPDEHSGEVRAYLLSSGVPESEVSGIHVTTTMAGDGPISDGLQPLRSRLLWYTTHLERSVGGIPIEGSYAFAAMSSDRKVITEGVYWPPIPARVLSRARALNERLATGSQRSTFLSTVKRTQPEVGDAEGTVVIVHTPGGYHGEFQAQALYSVVVRNPNGGKAHILRFDDTGTPVRMVDQVSSGIDSVKQR